MTQLDDLIKSSGLTYQEVVQALQISRSTLHIWRTKDEVPPARIADVAEVLKIDQLEYRLRWTASLGPRQVMPRCTRFRRSF